MTNIRHIEGHTDGKGKRFAIVASRFNEVVVEGLLEGALDGLTGQGVREDDITVIWVPGAYELPLAAQRAAMGKQFDAIIALGAVIRGGTPHFDYVAGQCVRGLAAVALNHDIPVTFGVLTTDTLEQALERSGGKRKQENKGREAALAAIVMVDVLNAVAP